MKLSFTLFNQIFNQFNLFYLKNTNFSLHFKFEIQMKFSIIDFNFISNEIEIKFFYLIFKFNSISCIEMKFFIDYIQKAPLHVAIEKENVEIVKLLLSCEKIDVNSLNSI